MKLFRQREGRNRKTRTERYKHSVYTNTSLSKPNIPTFAIDRTRQNRCKWICMPLVWLLYDYRVFFRVQIEYCRLGEWRMEWREIIEVIKWMDDVALLIGGVAGAYKMCRCMRVAVKVDFLYCIHRVANGLRLLVNPSSSATTIRQQSLSKIQVIYIQDISLPEGE